MFHYPNFSGGGKGRRRIIGHRHVGDFVHSAFFFQLSIVVEENSHRPRVFFVVARDPRDLHSPSSWCPKLPKYRPVHTASDHIQPPPTSDRRIRTRRRARRSRRSLVARERRERRSGILAPFLRAHKTPVTIVKNNKAANKNPPLFRFLLLFTVQFRATEEKQTH